MKTLNQLLFGLTLTLILSIDPREKRYFFQIHLYPQELLRKMKPGESIEDQILDHLARLTQHVMRMREQPDRVGVEVAKE